MSAIVPRQEVSEKGKVEMVRMAIRALAAALLLAMSHAAVAQPQTAAAQSDQLLKPEQLEWTVELVANGNIEATIDQAPEKQGFAAVDMLVKFLSGQPIDNLDTGVGIYTKENIGEVAKK